MSGSSALIYFNPDDNNLLKYNKKHMISQIIKKIIVVII
jgi:hypothetical protein